MVRWLVQATGPILEPVSPDMQSPADAVAVGVESAARIGLVADLTVHVLLEEAELTPKPALVDCRGGGAHDDMDLGMLFGSAYALHPTFRDLATRAYGCAPSRQLREELATIGRRGEEAMLTVTGGVNTHRGAIWALGLLTAAAVMAPADVPLATIAALAGRVASFTDCCAPTVVSHGSLVTRRYGVAGARGEARRGFPNVVGVALPALRATREAGQPERLARLDALIA